MKRKFSELYYAEEVNVLNDYKKITPDHLEELINFYDANVIPLEFTFKKRETNYFQHNIENIKMGYLNQLPYYNNVGELVKKSSKLGERKLKKGTLLYEKDLCKELWFLDYNGQLNNSFKIIDIQVPLKQKRSDKYGEIDLLGVTILPNQKVQINLIEVKPIRNPQETLLRAVVEAVTYRYIIENNKEKFVQDFKKYINKYDDGSRFIEKLKLILSNNLHYEMFELKSSIIAPREFYLHEFASNIFEKYKKNIDFYSIYYDKNMIDYGSSKSKQCLFSTGKVPLIEKISNRNVD